MREIKFRAWLIEEKRIVEVSNIAFLPSEDFYRVFPLGERPDRNYPTGKQCELMQFTGLLDKNGKEIYEGDICMFYKDYENNTFFYGIAFIDNKTVGGSWEIIRCDNVDPDIPELKGEDCLDSSAFWNDNFKIIGNIFENPELLEKK